MQSQEKEPHCDPKEIALKSFFLGPQAENAPWASKLLIDIFERWVEWRRSLFPKDGKAISQADQRSDEFVARRRNFESAAFELVARFEKEVPKFSPRYVGHMFSEISLPALIGHIVTLLHNPNNLSGESSRVGIQIEDEAVRFLLAMVGFSEDTAAGHFTSGGTVANLESVIRAQSRYALWLSAGALMKAKGLAESFDPFSAALMGWPKFDQVLEKMKQASIPPEELMQWNLDLQNPFQTAARYKALNGRDFLGPVMLIPENKHYSWNKGCRLLGLGDESLWPVALDSWGKLSVEHLKRLLVRAQSEDRPVLLVVSVVGTTELGGIDPVNEVQDVLDEWREEHGAHIWHHVDAAYGGLFRTLDLTRTQTLSTESRRALSAMPRVDSITIDPHKLGYVPYASGTFLAREKRNYYFSSFADAPYIDFNKNIDRGPFTLEGSRSAAGAVATWMTAKTMGLNSEGYGLLLERTTRICKELALQMFEAKLPLHIAPGCDTNVLCFSCAKEGESLSRSNERTLRVYRAFSPKENGPFIVSKTSLHWEHCGPYLDRWTSSWSANRDAKEVVLIRMCMMNPFFGTSQAEVNYSDLFIELLKGVLSADS